MRRLGTLPMQRVVMAFIAAPAVSAFALSVAGLVHLGADPLNVMGNALKLSIMIALGGGYPLTLLIGVPVYVILRRWFWPNAFNCAGVGALIAVAPWLLFKMAESLPQRALILSEAALVGAIGGFVFWGVAAAGLKRPKPPTQAQAF